MSGADYGIGYTPKGASERTARGLGMLQTALARIQVHLRDAETEWIRARCIPAVQAACGEPAIEAAQAALGAISGMLGGLEGARRMAVRHADAVIRAARQADDPDTDPPSRGPRARSAEPPASTPPGPASSHAGPPHHSGDGS